MVEEFTITTTEFMNYLNAKGTAKLTVVGNAKARHENEQEYFDFWAEFKHALKRVIITNGSKEDLKEVIERVKDEARPNYQAMVNGFISFWGRKDLVWIQPSKKIYHLVGLRISINPEIGLMINGTEYLIKLFLRSNDTIDRKQADIVLTLMEQGLRKKVGEDVVFAVLDVRRGKLYAAREYNPKLSVLLKAEAKSFQQAWKGL